MKMLQCIVFSRVCQFLCSEGGSRSPYKVLLLPLLITQGPPHHIWTLFPAPLKLCNLDLTIQTPPDMFSLVQLGQHHTGTQPAMFKLVYHVARKSEDKRAVSNRLKYLFVQHSLIFTQTNIPTLVFVISNILTSLQHSQNVRMFRTKSPTLVTCCDHMFYLNKTHWFK